MTSKSDESESIDATNIEHGKSSKISRGIKDEGGGR